MSFYLRENRKPFSRNCFYDLAHLRNSFREVSMRFSYLSRSARKKRAFFFRHTAKYEVRGKNQGGGKDMERICEDGSNGTKGRLQEYLRIYGIKHTKRARNVLCIELDEAFVDVQCAAPPHRAWRFTHERMVCHHPATDDTIIRRPHSTWRGNVNLHHMVHADATIGKRHLARRYPANHT